MEQLLSLIPWKEVLSSPNSVIAVAFIILLVYTTQQGGKREEVARVDSQEREKRLTTIIDTTLKDHGNLIQQQTNALGNINSTMIRLHDSVCKVEERVDDIEDILNINKGENP